MKTRQLVLQFFSILHFACTPAWNASEFRSHLTHHWDNRLWSEGEGKKNGKISMFGPSANSHLSKVCQARSWLSKALTRLPQQARHVVRSLESPHVYSRRQKPQPSGGYLLQMQCLCSIPARSSEHPEKLEINCVSAKKKIHIDRHKLFSVL